MGTVEIPTKRTSWKLSYWLICRLNLLGNLQFPTMYINKWNTCLKCFVMPVCRYFILTKIVSTACYFKFKMYQNNLSIIKMPCSDLFQCLRKLWHFMDFGWAELSGASEGEVMSEMANHRVHNGVTLPLCQWVTETGLWTESCSWHKIKCTELDFRDGRIKLWAG